MGSCSPGRDSGAGTRCRWVPVPARRRGRSRRLPRCRRPSATSRSWSAAARWKVEGVGLVVGLDNTGADPPPSWHRKQLVDEMSKAGVEHAEKLLANPQFSMVIVRLTIPIGVSPDGPARRPGRGPAGLRHHEPGRRLLDDDPAARSRSMRRTGPLGRARDGACAGAGHDRHAGQAERSQGRPRARAEARSRRITRSPSSSRRTARASARPRCSRRWSTSGSTRPRTGIRREWPPPRPPVISSSRSPRSTTRTSSASSGSSSSCR